MRIIAGSARGHRLKAPRGRGIRPTSDKVREAIFNILGDVSGLRVLDLFAGTGALGLEALSRGAESCLFVDSSREALSLIEANALSCGLMEGSDLLLADPARGLAKVERRGEIYDLVLMDPPYGKGLAQSALQRLAESGLLAPGAVVVGEHSKREALAAPSPLRLTGTRLYGDTAVSFFDISSPEEG